MRQNTTLARLRSVSPPSVSGCKRTASHGAHRGRAGHMRNAAIFRQEIEPPLRWRSLFRGICGDQQYFIKRLLRLRVQKVDKKEN